MNDELESVPSMSVDREDIKRPQARQRQPVNKSPVQTPQDSSKGAPRGWIFVMLFLVLALAGAIGFLYKSLNDEKTSLADVTQRLVSLEDKLTSTDSSISESEAMLAIKRKQAEDDIKENAAQVRKLWGVAYDTNRKAIANNTTLNSAQKKTIASLQADKSKHLVLLKTIEANLKNVDLLTKETSQRTVFLQESIEELEKVTGDSTDQVAAINTLKTRLSKNEDALKSLDVHRRNITDDVRKIKALLHEEGGLSSVQ